MATQPTMSTKTKAIVLAVAILASVVITGFVIRRYVTVKSSGKIKTVNCAVWWDAAATQKVTSIDWGILAPGENRNVTVFIQNTGNQQAQLMLATQNWVPTITPDFIALYWNYSNATYLPRGGIIPVIFTLEVSAEITGIEDFSFDIVIIAYG